MTLQVKHPKQERSQRTLERMLRATEGLLETRLFEEVTVADIVARARTSVGAFYARFRDKDALLPMLYARYDGTLAASIQGALEKATRSQTLRDAVETLVATFVRTYRNRRGLFRAVGLFARSHPESIPAAMRAARVELHRSIAAVLLAHRTEILHADPEPACELGLFMVAAACREKILFGAPHATTIVADDAVLMRELTTALLAYLQWPGASSAAKKRKSRCSRPL